MNKYASIMLEVNGYYVLYNGNQPFTHIKRCRVIEIYDNIYINKYVYDRKIGEWKFSWYATWIMITHCMIDICK